MHMLYRELTKACIICSYICHNYCDVACRVIWLKPAAQQAQCLTMRQAKWDMCHLRVFWIQDASRNSFASQICQEIRLTMLMSYE